MTTEPFCKRLPLRQLLQVCPYPLEPLHVPDPDQVVEIESYVHRPGLLLAGFPPTDRTERHVLVFGREDFLFLQRHTPEQQSKWLDVLWACHPPMVIVGRDADMLPGFLDGAQRHGVAVFRSEWTSRAILALGFRWLERLTVSWHRIPGNLLSIFGVGVLIVGDSGIGKSEATLDLLVRGHVLIADDAVDIACFQDGTVIGRTPEASRGLVEIRGLGILDVRHLFGLLAVRDETVIELVVRLIDAVREPLRERLDRELREFTLPQGGATLPLIELPVVSGRNIATLIEAAVRWFLLRRQGIQAGQDLIRLTDRLAMNRTAYGPPPEPRVSHRPESDTPKRSSG